MSGRLLIDGWIPDYDGRLNWTTGPSNLQTQSEISTFHLVHQYFIRAPILMMASTSHSV